MWGIKYVVPEITGATFNTGDAASQARQRLDYQGGLVGDKFYLQNCGFFNDTTPLNTILTRQANGTPPAVDFSQF